MNSRNNRRIVGRVIIYAVRVITGQSAGLSVYPLMVARYKLGKDVPAATKNCWRRLFYVVRVLSQDSLRVFLYTPLSLLGKNCVKTFLRQRGIVGVVLFAVRVISNKSRRLVVFSSSNSSNMAQAGTLLTSILEVPCSNIGRDNAYYDLRLRFFFQADV
jgi:hypothetical protein